MASNGRLSPGGQGRCLSPDLVDVANAWMEKFPSYNLYLHDDIAVDAFFDLDFPEFPNLKRVSRKNDLLLYSSSKIAYSFVAARRLWICVSSLPLPNGLTFGEVSYLFEVPSVFLNSVLSYLFLL